MKGTKMQKGITLIALIITIIVLLILAVVAIAAIQDSDILLHADRSAIMHEVGTISEKIRLEAQAIKLAGAISPDNAEEPVAVNALKNLYKKYDNLEDNDVGIRIISILSDSTSIPETIPEGEYYVVIPEKLNYNIARGKGAEEADIIGDVFVVDNEFNVYYITDLKDKPLSSGTGSIIGGGTIPSPTVPTTPVVSPDNQ